MILSYEQTERQRQRQHQRQIESIVCMVKRPCRLEIEPSPPFQVAVAAANAGLW